MNIVLLFSLVAHIVTAEAALVSSVLPLNAKPENYSESREFGLHAASQNETNSELNEFDKVVQLFNQGTPVTFDDFKGYYISGRCIVFTAKRKIWNSVFVYVSQNGGPALGDELLGFSSYHHVESDPDFFDGGTSKENLDWMRGDIKESIANKQTGLIKDGVSTITSWNDFEPNGRLDMQGELRKSGNYLVLVIKNLIRQRYEGPIYGGGDSNNMAEAGQNVSACYFFKKHRIDSGSGGGDEDQPSGGASYECTYLDRYRRVYRGLGDSKAIAGDRARQACYAANEPFRLDCKLQGCSYLGN